MLTKYLAISKNSGIKSFKCCYNNKSHERNLFKNENVSRIYHRPNIEHIPRIWLSGQYLVQKRNRM